MILKVIVPSFSDIFDIEDLRDLQGEFAKLHNLKLEHRDFLTLMNFGYYFYRLKLNGIMTYHFTPVIYFC